MRVAMLAMMRELRCVQLSMPRDEVCLCKLKSVSLAGAAWPTGCYLGSLADQVAVLLDAGELGQGLSITLL